MRWLLYAWCAPLAAVGWLHILALWALGLIRPYTIHPGPVVEFRKQDGPDWWEAAWRGWFGYSFWFAIICDAPEGEDSPPRKLRHELHHCNRQWLCWGPLFPLAYLGVLCWMAARYRSWATGYYRHPFERAARGAEWHDPAQ